MYMGSTFANVIIIISLLVLICVCLYFAYYKFMHFIKSTYVKSSIDNRYYLVKKSSKNKEQNAADTLAEMNRRTCILLDNLKNSNENYYELSRNVKLLTKRYSPESLTENILNEGTSYTINKGSELAFCISTRDHNENIYDINKMMYILIHELSHVGCESFGHDAEFIKFFKFLALKAVKYDLLYYVDYKKAPEEYCGIDLTSNILS